MDNESNFSHTKTLKLKANQTQQNIPFGNYVLVEELGHGAMGKVFKAYHRYLKRYVALKIPTNLGADDLQRFLREAETMAKLRHPNIIHIHEVGSYNNQPYFTMDYIEGQDLSSYYKKNTLSSRQIIQLMIEICHAIFYAHQQGIVHRDLKPANIMITKEQKAIIMDFGLAKNFNENQKLSQSGMILGTITYMSPEQAQGKNRKIDERSDVYSLGVILYELLTERAPFINGSSFMLLHDIVNRPPIPLREIKAKIPKALDNICLKALNKKPKDRYQTAKQFADDLQSFIEGKNIQAKATKSYKSIFYKNQILIRISMWILIPLAFVMITFATFHYRSEALYYKKQSFENEKILRERFNFGQQNSIDIAISDDFETLIEQYEFLQNCQKINDVLYDIARLSIPSMEEIQTQMLNVCLQQHDKEEAENIDVQQRQSIQNMKRLYKKNIYNQKSLNILARYFFTYKIEKNQHLDDWWKKNIVELQQRAAQQNPEELWLLFSYGRFLQFESSSKGLKIMEKAIYKHRQPDWMNYHIATVYEELDMYNKVIKHINLAVKHAPDHLWLRFWRGKFLLEKIKDPQGLQDWYLVYTKIQNHWDLGDSYNTTEFFSKYIKYLTISEKYPQALEVCRRAIEIQNWLFQYHFFQGRVYQLQNMRDKAIECYNKAIEMILKSDDKNLVATSVMLQKMQQYIHSK